MKTKSLFLFTSAIGFLFSIFSGNAQEATDPSEEIIGGYVNYTSDHQREYLNQMITISTQEPEWKILPSPFKENYEDWGEIVAGTWVKNEYYAITNLVRGGVYYVGNYIAYEPLTQNYRFIDASAGLIPSNSADMAYNYVTGELFAVTKSNTLIKLSTTDSSSVVIGNITLDGIEMQNDPFRAIACDKDGILYGINDNGMIYSINQENAQAQYVCTLDVPMGVYQQSAAFSLKTNKLYWTNAGSSTTLYEIDIKTGKTTQISETPGLVGIFVHEYPDGAPYYPVSDIKVIKNPSDYTEATLVYTLPEKDMMDQAITSNANVEIWKGSSQDDMQRMTTINNLTPGQTYTYSLKENSGTYYYAIRVQNKKSGQFSAFAGTYCSFFNIGFPYHTSFETDDENGSFFALGNGWKAYENTEKHQLVKEGKRAYGVIEDTLSQFCITGLNVYADVEYKLTVPAVGYNAFWESVMSTPWYEAPEKPLLITLADTSFELVLQGNGGHKTYNDYSFTFTPKQNGLLNIFFRATGEDDAYFIDSVTIEQLTHVFFPAPVSDLQLTQNQADNLWAEIEFNTPETTADNQPLERFSGVYVQYSHSPNFLDASGNPDFYCDTLDANKGSKVQHRIQFPENGYYYIRVYAFNSAGISQASSVLETGYKGNRIDYTLTAKDTEGNTLNVDSAFLTPLFPESDQRIDATIGKPQISFSQIEAGRYQLTVYAYGYAPYQEILEPHETGSKEITMQGIELHRQPQSIEDLQIVSIQHDDRSVDISWTNPSLDQDGNPLKALSGIILEAYTSDAGFSVKDTVFNMEIGKAAQTRLMLQKQGHYMLKASAYNEFGVSELQEAEIGYVGKGFLVSIECTDTEGKKVNAAVTLISTQNDTSVTLDASSTSATLPGGSYQLYASADYYDRISNMNLNIVSDTTLKIDRFSYTYQKPIIQRFEPGEKDALITWKNTGSRNFEDGFESYPDFTIENFGEYELYGQKYKGYFGGVSFPNMQQAYAYMVFNPSATVPSITDQAYWNTHSGNKMLITTFSLKNDDWIIHPVQGGGTLSFWAAGAQLNGSVPEKFQVLYSTSDNSPANFVNASNREYLLTERNWTLYEFKLPENAQYFAIHCITEDGSLFKIDDLKYTLNHGSVVEKPASYEIYLNGEKIKDLGAQDTSYHYQDLPNGKNTLGIKAIYANGASEMEEREIEVGRVITAPINLNMKNTDTGWLFTWSMPANETSQYYKVFLDGKFVINTIYKQFLFDNIEETDTEKHIAGVCNVVNEYFSDTVYIEFQKELATEESIDFSLPKVYPNPSDGSIHVSVNQSGTFEVYNIAGTRMFSKTINEGTHPVELSSLPKGIYIYRFHTTEATYTGKIILK